MDEFTPATPGRPVVPTVPLERLQHLVVRLERAIDDYCLGYDRAHLAQEVRHPRHGIDADRTRRPQ